MRTKYQPPEGLTPFDIDQELVNPETSKVHLICVPYAPSVTYGKGAENAPLAILNASTQVELFDIETNSEPYKNGISMNWINPKQRLQKIWTDIDVEVTESIQKKQLPILLGGEHSISHGAIRAAKSLYPDLTVLQIDAHADLRKKYMNSQFNHACALRHSFEHDIPIVQVGIRSACKEEYDLIKANPDKITTFFQQKDGLKLKKILKSIKTKNIYITIDLDGLDPSVIPHVGTPEPGGISWFDTIAMLKALFSEFNVTGADIVELAPSETSTVSDFTTAKLLYKLISLSQAK